MVNYVHRTAELFSRPDDEVLDAYHEDLRRLYGIARDEVEAAFVFRAPFVEPIWPLGYSERRPSSSVIPGRLYLVSTAQIYPRVNSWNSCCEMVEAMLPLWDRETRELVALPASQASAA
jgi:protoporphyrinogen oxidase